MQMRQRDICISQQNFYFNRSFPLSTTYSEKQQTRTKNKNKQYFCCLMKTN